MATGSHRVSAVLVESPTASVRCQPMDLRTWITDEHEGLRTRFDHGIVANVPPARWRERGGDGGSSIAWLLLHTAWHEDLAIQSAVQGIEPLLHTWRPGLGLGAVAPWGGLGEAEDPAITATLDLEALGSYADAVHDATAQWLATADLTALEDVPAGSERISGLADVSKDDVPWLHAMWNAKPAAWFLQWEAIGHRQGHLGEMVSMRSRLGLSPF
jgi:hypothetical protein